MTRKPAAVFLLTMLAVLGLALIPAAVAAKGGQSAEHGPGNGNGNGNGNGGGGGNDTSSLSLVVLDPDDGGANYGEQVTFEVSTTATTEPFVELDCYQEGTLVYAASAGFFAGYLWPWTQNFNLASSMWTGGAADCTATLSYWDGRRMRDLASLSLRVEA